MTDSFFSPAVLTNTYSFICQKRTQPPAILPKPQQPDPRKAYMDKIIKDIISRRQQPAIKRIQLPQPQHSQIKKNSHLGVSPAPTPSTYLPARASSQLITPSPTLVARKTPNPRINSTSNQLNSVDNRKNFIPSAPLIMTPEQPRRAMKSTKKPKQKRVYPSSLKKQGQKTSISQKRGERKNEPVERRPNQKDLSHSRICPICRKPFPVGKFKLKVKHLHECSKKYAEELEQVESESSPFNPIY